MGCPGKGTTLGKATLRKHFLEGRTAEGHLQQVLPATSAPFLHYRGIWAVPHSIYRSAAPIYLFIVIPEAALPGGTVQKRLVGWVMPLPLQLGSRLQVILIPSPWTVHLRFSSPSVCTSARLKVPSQGQTLVTMIFSGWDCCTYPSTPKIGHGNTKWCPSGSPKCHTYSSLLPLYSSASSQWLQSIALCQDGDSPSYLMILWLKDPWQS